MKEEPTTKCPPRSKSQARYISGSDVDVLVDLLLKFRELTLSRSAFTAATSMIIELGGADLIEADGII